MQSDNETPPSTAPITPQEAAQLSQELQAQDAAERLKTLYARYGKRVVASTSFGVQSVVMLHLLKRHAPQIPIVFIDTGYHFPETYRYAYMLENEWGLALHWAQPKMTAARQEALYGRMWEQDKEAMDKYAIINKVEPMNSALRELGCDIWLSGLRREQSSTRKDRTFAEAQKNTLKVYPILDWSDEQVRQYIDAQRLPLHPLTAQGYVTMGDWHSTKPIGEVDGAEATRFGGAKYECGLHLASGNTDFQI